MNSISEREIELYLKWLRLANAPGLGPAGIKKLFDLYGNVDQIIYAILNENRSKTNSKAREYLESTVNLDQERNIIHSTYACGAKICCLNDDDYPKNLKTTSKPPPLLYYKGSLKDLSPRSLALVGQVDPSPEGIKRAEKFARLCVQNDIQVISGLARGIDTASHKAALKYGGRTYAVVGHGIDYCYPSENKALFEEIALRDAVISQFPTGTKPQKWFFPMRNEVMCTISSGTVIVEAKEGCGSLIQADFSFKHGRRVFVLNNNLLNENSKSWSSGLLNKGAVGVSDFKTVTTLMEDIKPEIFNKAILTEGGIQESLFSKPYINTQPNQTDSAILFDFDGVLFDAAKLMLEAYKSSLNELGKNNISDKEIARVIKYSPPYVFKSFGVDGTLGNQIFKRKYFELIPTHATFFNDTGMVVRELYRRDFKIGIVTSQPLSRFRKLMELCPFKENIDTQITWNDIPSSRQKPHPDGILKALELLKCKPETSYYIGDTTNDMKAAFNAHVIGIAVTWGLEPATELKNSQYKFIISNPSQLLEVIK